MRDLSRRQFLRNVGGAAALVAAGPLLVPRLGQVVSLDPDPFEYGIASGDPLLDRVILWTRVSAGRPTTVRWEVASDPGFRRPVADGTQETDADRDYNVKVDVTGLRPGRTYWYRFAMRGARSRIGRTRTPPANPRTLRFALTSCQEFQAGLYHVWRHVAAQDLDFVLFVGDYIYEYGSPYPDDPNPMLSRKLDPPHEIVTLDDYRRRYRTYRTDPDLRAAHAAHPFIAVWDDHEVANDRWRKGSEEHDPEEGSYARRQAAAYRAYFETMPIRVNRQPIYRRFSFGRLADLFMLDGRTYRDEPIGKLLTDPLANTDPAISDPRRTYLGKEQKKWFKSGLRRSRARWKLVGNQTLIAHADWSTLPDEIALPLSELTGRPPLPPNKVPRDGIPVNHDQWDDYQPEKREILEWIRNPGGDVTPAERFTGNPNRIQNVVFLAGDFHMSFVSELYVNIGDAPAEFPVATEFAGPSITTVNANEYIGKKQIGRAFPEGSTNAALHSFFAWNRHFRFVDLDANGYVLVDVEPSRLRSQYFSVASAPGAATPIQDPNARVVPTIGGTWEVQSGGTRLTPGL
jgi:alkaline phosphatase D